MSRLVDVNKKTSPRKDGNNDDAKKEDSISNGQTTLENATKAENYAVLTKLKSVSFGFLKAVVDDEGKDSEMFQFR